MQCPLCLDSPLEPKFIRGIEVDICPRCRGIWLDRGEIDRLGDDALPPPAAVPSPPPPPHDDRGYRDGDRRYWDDDRRHRDDDRRYRDDDRPKGKKRKSKAKRLADLLDDILD